MVWVCAGREEKRGERRDTDAFSAQSWWPESVSYGHGFTGGFWELPPATFPSLAQGLTGTGS